MTDHEYSANVYANAQVEMGANLRRVRARLVRALAKYSAPEIVQHYTLYIAAIDDRIARQA